MAGEQTPMAVVVCDIWSHSHAPPLRPPASIAFDLRKVPNPPKHIRDQYDGRSKRLQEHLLHQQVFVDLLEGAVEDISRAIDESILPDSMRTDAPDVTTSSSHIRTNLSGDSTVESVDSARTYGPTAVSDSSGDRFLVPDAGGNNKNSRDSRVEHESALQPSREDPAAESGEIVSEEEGPKSGLVLRISCRCERGRHRSVAFAEELGRRLAKRIMPETARAIQVVVRVQHRDVEVKSRDSGRVRRGARGQSRVVGAAIVADQEESQDLHERV